MTDYFYQEKDQVIALIHEESYGKCQGNTSAWAKCDNPTNFKGLDLVHKGPDLPPTIREKIDYFGVGGGKYPTMIVNAMHNPIEITLNMPLQSGRFLSYAIGTATTSGTDPYTHDIPESINHSMESFCLHVEQKNTTGTETIIYELLGCIVKSITYHIGYNENDGQIMQSVNITSPYAVILEDADKLASPPSYLTDVPYTFGDVDETSDKILEENSGDILPDAVSLLEFTIENTITFMPDVGNLYFTDFTCGERKVSFHIVGFNKKSTIFGFWSGIWETDTHMYDTATTRICSNIKLTRSANDYIKIFVYNWKITNYSCRFFNVQEGSLRAEDFTLTSATPRSTANRMLIDASGNNCEVKDDRANTYYHHTT